MRIKQRIPKNIQRTIIPMKMNMTYSFNNLPIWNSFLTDSSAYEAF